MKRSLCVGPPRAIVAFSLVSLSLFLPVSLLAQSPSDLDVRDKTELFLQHIVKVARIDPAKYVALVLEYEIGTALAELLAASDKEGEEAGAKENPVGFVLGDFVERAIQEIHPAYAKLVGLVEAGKLAEGRAAARDLSGSSDPYVAAHAALALAEIEYRSLEEARSAALIVDADWERLVKACERIVSKDRLYLTRDWRASELIACSFQKLKKPLLEFVQYAILLTDYNDLPAEVTARAKERLAALTKEVGFPLSSVAEWMDQVEKLLAKEVTSKEPTQRKETEIVYALDKLIELQEARERKT